MDIGTLKGRIELEDEFSSVLSTVVHKLDGFASTAENVFGTVAVAAAATVTAITSISVAIIALGNKGSDVNDVATSFTTFAGSARQATAALTELRAGTLGTVSDFDLMKTGTKLLSAGVKLSAEDFGTMAKAAQMMSSRGLGPTKDMLDLVTQAMVTGNTASLASRLGIINVKNATQEYARALGVHVNELTKTQRAEAARNEILGMLEEQTKKNGTAVRSFADSIAAAQVVITNWISGPNGLARQIAISPQVMAAVEAIGDAFTRNFGDKGASAIEFIMGWINKFADGVKIYAPMIIDWFAKILGQISDLYNFVKDSWNAIPDWLKEVGKEVIITTALIGGLNLALKLTAGMGIMQSLTSLVGGFGQLGNSIKVAWGFLAEFIDLTKAFGFLNTLKAMIPALETMFVGMAGWFATASEAVGGFAMVLFDISNPVGWVIGAITLLVVGLRVLTGSFDFITTPAKAVWQALKDIWTITVDVAGKIWDVLIPAVEAMAVPFVAFAEVINTVWSLSMKKMRTEIEAAWILMKNMPGPVKEMINLLKMLHSEAEGIRRGVDINLPGNQYSGEVQIPPMEYQPAGGKIGFKPDEDNEAQMQRVQNIMDSMFGHDLQKQINDYEVAFSNLESKGIKPTAKQMEAMGEKVAEFVEKGGTLGPTLSKIYAGMSPIAGLAEKFAADQADQAKLSAAILKGEEEFASNRERIKQSDRALSDSIHQQNIADIDREISASKSATESTLTSLDEKESAWTRYYALLADKEEATYHQTRLVQERVNKDRMDAFTLSNAMNQENATQVIDAEKAKGDAALATIDKQHETTQITMELDRTTAAINRMNQRYGVTRQQLINTERDAKQTLDRILAMGNAPQEVIDKARKEWFEANQKLNSAEIKAWQLKITSAQLYAEALKEIGSITPGITGQMISGVGNLVDAWTKASVAAKFYKDRKLETGQGVSGGEAALTLATGAVNVWNSTSTGGIGSRTASGAMAGAGAGMAAGAMMGSAAGPYAIAIGAIAGALIGLTRGLIAAANEGRDAIEAYANSVSGGFDGLHKQLAVLGADGEELWKQLSGVAQDDKEGAIQAIKEVQDALQALTNDINKYGITWEMMGDNPKRQLEEQNRAAATLYASIRRLTSAGYDYDEVIKQMSPDLNDWLGATLRAGLQIPEAMKPIIESLIRSHQLTEDNARAMLGLAEDATPSLDEIAEAAGRYGLTLDMLGPKVKQLVVTETANQIVKDFNLMTLAGIDFNLIMQDVTTTTVDAAGNVTEVTTGMHKSLQDLVLQALTLGITLPEALKPVLQKLIDAGGENGLVDQFGNALSDLEGINFEKPLSESIDLLITKLGELIDTLTGPGGVADAFNNLPGMPSTPAPGTPGTPGGPPEIPPPYNYRDPNYAAYQEQERQKALAPKIPPPANAGAQATGGNYMVNKPTWFLAGEAGPEFASFTPLGSPSGGSGTPTRSVGGSGGSSQKEIVIPITLKVGREEMTRQTIRTLVEVGT